MPRNSKPPTPPPHLSPATKRFWRSVVQEFVLEQHDLQLLRLACENLDGAEAARQQVAREGRIFLDAKGRPKSHPAVSQHRDCSVIATRILRELRLSDTAPDARPPRLEGGK